MTKLVDLKFDNVLEVHKNHVRLKKFESNEFVDFIIVGENRWIALQYPNQLISNNLNSALTSITISATEYLAETL